MPWTSACPAPSFLYPNDPAAHRPANTSLALCQCLWQVKVEESATHWWGLPQSPNIQDNYFSVWGQETNAVIWVCANLTTYFHQQSDASFGGSRSIKNLRRSNSTTQVSQQTNIGLRYLHTPVGVRTDNVDVVNYRWHWYSACGTKCCHSYSARTWGTSILRSLQIIR